MYGYARHKILYHFAVISAHRCSQCVLLLYAVYTCSHGSLIYFLISKIDILLANVFVLAVAQ